MMGAAEPSEIVVGEVTRNLARDGGVAMIDRGEAELRGLAGTYHLHSIPPR